MTGEYAAAVKAGLARRSRSAYEELRSALDAAACELDSDPSAWTIDPPEDRPFVRMKVLVARLPIGQVLRLSGDHWQVDEPVVGPWAPTVRSAGEAVAWLLATPGGASAAVAAQHETSVGLASRVADLRWSSRVLAATPAAGLGLGAGVAACLERGAYWTLTLWTPLCVLTLAAASFALAVWVGARRRRRPKP